MLYRNTLQQWDRSLTSPGDGPLSFRAASHRDATATYARDALRVLGELGAAQLHVPTVEGGAMQSLEQSIAASYAIGRRDASVSLAGGLQMWSHLIWMVGTPEQKRDIQRVLAHNAPISLAASEAKHGADVLSSECHAEWDGARYRLFGEKWPIGQASHCEVAFVLARTRKERGARSLSLFYVNADTLGGPGCQRLDRVVTVGMRGSDLAGLRFEGAALSQDALIGPEGAGLELTLKLFQITRPLVASLALGPGDTMLRIAVETALQRRLYGGSVADLPTVRRDLVRAWVDLHIAEVVELVCARGAHVHPSGLSLSSLVAKVVAPARIASLAEACVRVLGARWYFDHFREGIFGRMYRDQSIVPIIDGSTDVCLHGLAAQLLAVLRSGFAHDAALWFDLLSLQRPVPPLDYRALELSARGSDPVVAQLLHTTEIDGIDPAVRRVAATVAREVAALRDGVQERMARTTPEPWDRAQRYADLHALACCAGFAIANRGLGMESERAAWMWMVMRRLLSASTEGPAEHHLVDELFESLVARVKRGDVLSVVLCPEDHDEGRR